MQIESPTGTKVVRIGTADVAVVTRHDREELGAVAVNLFERDVARRIGVELGNALLDDDLEIVGLCNRRRVSWARRRMAPRRSARSPTIYRAQQPGGKTLSDRLR